MYFNYQEYQNCTELAKYLLTLKEEEIATKIKWETLHKAYSNPKQNMRNLC